MKYLKTYENFEFNKLPMVESYYHKHFCFFIGDIGGDFPNLYYIFRDDESDSAPFIEWIPNIKKSHTDYKRLDEFLTENLKYLSKLEKDFNNPTSMNFSSGGYDGKSLIKIKKFKKTILTPLLKNLEWAKNGINLGIL